MRQLKVIEHISLDGVIQHSADDGGFPYGDWSVPYRTPAGRDAVMAAHGESFDLLLGRRTYEIWSGFWPTAPSSPIADRINAAAKYVATHRPESLGWGPFFCWARGSASSRRERRHVHSRSSARKPRRPASSSVRTRSPGL